LTNTNLMDKKDLITSAGKPGPFSKATAEAFNEALPLYEWMQVNIPLFEHLSHQ